MPEGWNGPEKVGKKKEEEKQEGAPLWMVTMSDMNTLLMTFFIILFSLMVIERDKYRHIQDEPEPRSLTDPEAFKRILEAEENISVIFSGREKGETRAPARQDQPMSVGQIHFRVSKTPAGTVVTVGGEYNAFFEGKWDLREEHKDVLNRFIKWMADRENRVVVRGFTAGNLEDSLVRIGDRVVPFRKSGLQRSEGRRLADHWLLASLRARSVREYLIDGFNELKIAPERIDVQIDAYNERVADNLVEEERYKNRRVEIVILPHS